MPIQNGLLFAQRLIKLLKEFGALSKTTPNEFIDCKLKRKGDFEDEIFEELCEHFLILTKHTKLFESIVQNFWGYFGLKPFNKELITTLMYIIIFVLEEENCKQTVKICTRLKYKFSTNVLQYFMVEDNILDVTQAACKVFDNDYVLEHFVRPILNKQDVIKKVYDQVQQWLATQQVVPKPVTIPNPPSCSVKIKRIPSPPMNTPAETARFKSVAVPKSVLQGDLKVQEGLEKARMENRKRAVKLLEFAHNKAFRCASSPQPTKSASSLENPPTYQIKLRAAPPKKDVAVKQNAAFLMREAATFVKEKESEIRKIEALTQTAFDPSYLQAFEDGVRKCKEQRHLQDIELKHLKGQLTYEEAILAKQNVIKHNQQKMEEFKLERCAILDEIERWRQIEQSKIKALVEKSQHIEKAAKDAGRKMQEHKKYQARLVEHETKELLREASERKHQELACKVRLIQELRALEQVRSLQIKEFDPTETPNFGLLCEMSIAELQERLVLMKVELEEELEQRRKSILNSRQNQQQLIEDIKQFIGDSRVAKPKPATKQNCKLKETPEIIDLRQRLYEAKYMRTSTRQPNVLGNK